jgi:cytochrome c peroxidase
MTFHRQNTMHQPSRLIFLSLLLLGYLIACRKTETPETDTQLNLPANPYDYSGIIIPDHLHMAATGGPPQNAAADNDNTPASNPLTNHGATLGRVLFYDRNLSKNSAISCASCHVQDKGFSDPARLSVGFNGGLTRRHSMGLANARWYNRGRFFWDERAGSLEEQVLMPFVDQTEMGLTFGELVERIQASPHYAPLFTQAFGSETVNIDRISRALAQFVRSIVSTRSKYDLSRPAVDNPIQDFPAFTASENRGKRLFFQAPGGGGLGCVACHSTEAFINAPGGPTNNGLDLETVADRGAGEVFPAPQFQGAFKVPSLKNIAITAPYMHDGRFQTLEEVVEHYNSGVKSHPNLAPQLKDPKGNPRRLNLTPQQKADLVAFLQTLTDEPMRSDPMYSDPFRR